MNKRTLLKYFSIVAWQNCRACTTPQCLVACMSYPTDSILIGKHHLQATEALLVSLIPACFSPPFPPQHPSLLIDSILARTNNRLDTSKKAACWWPTWKWPRSGGEGRELWKPAAGPRAKVWSPVDWRPSSPEERVFCCRAKRGARTPHHHHHPPEDDRCAVRSLQQGESIRHLYNWLRMREKRGEKDGKRERETGRQIVWVCVYTWVRHRAQNVCFSCFVCV